MLETVPKGLLPTRSFLTGFSFKKKFFFQPKNQKKIWGGLRNTLVPNTSESNTNALTILAGAAVVRVRTPPFCRLVKRLTMIRRAINPFHFRMSKDTIYCTSKMNITNQ